MMIFDYKSISCFLPELTVGEIQTAIPPVPERNSTD